MNPIKTDKFIKGQKLITTYLWDQPDKCIFVRYIKNTDKAIIKTQEYFGCDTWEVPVKSLSPA
jgi:hypothetical protein